MQHFYTVKELSVELGLCTRTVYRLLWSKRLPALKLHRSWRIARKDLDVFRR